MKFRHFVSLVLICVSSLAAFAASPAELAIQKAAASIAKQPDHYAHYNNLAFAYARRARETSDVAFYAKAEETLKKSFALAPENFEGLRVQAWLQLGRHEFAQALETAKKLNRKAPDDVMVYGYLVDANIELGNYEEAVNAAQWMLDLRPGNIPGLTRAAYLRELHGNLTGSLELMTAAYESTPEFETEDRAWLLTQIAHLHSLRDEPEKAELAVRKALAAFPNYHYALGTLAQIHIGQKRYDEAVTLLETRYKAAPHPENLFALAEALHLAGRTTEARTAFVEFEKLALAESVTADNSNHELILYYADYARNPVKALEIAEMESKRRQDAHTLDCLAWALAANGQYQKANEVMQRALRFGLRDPKVLGHAKAIQEKLANVNSTAVVPDRSDSITVIAKLLEPGVDLRNAEVFARTLFSRDDQILQQLGAGIDAGQHEGGGKSLEIRRFGFNVDHGGTNGGLKILVDGVQQNQGTQGHGQGYLGALKSLSPELIEGVTIINGPFSPEYGDFSGLGVVHIRQRESLPDQFMARLQAGSFHQGRGFLSFSPDAHNTDAYAAYEGSYTDGPFQNPSRYRRDNVNANYTRTIDDNQKLGFRLLFGRNHFYSSGQLPLDLVSTGELDRFGFIDPTGGGRVKLGTASAWYSKSFAGGGNLKLDGFLSRSLFDLYSNFTFFKDDPVRGDGFQQHDSRLQQGANAQYSQPHKRGGIAASFLAGLNFHDNQINVGLYPREGRTPTGVNTRANAHVTNEAGYAQETVSLLQGRLILGGGLRIDTFRYGVRDRVDPNAGGLQYAHAWQGKGNAAFTPSHSLPLTLHLNYGRGMNSIDARAVVQHPEKPRLGTTDFSQVGASSNLGRVALSADLFLIDHSNEQVYVPDDGSFEFQGPSRAYGFEAKASIALTRHLSWSGNLTRISNAFFKGGDHRVYVASAPHFVAGSAITLSSWRGWSGSLRMRAINHYRLDQEDPSIVAAGHTIFDLGASRRITRRVDFSLSLDNLANRGYYETQNYFESRVTPDAPVLARIHATPGFPLTVTLGLTFRFGAK